MHRTTEEESYHFELVFVYVGCNNVAELDKGVLHCDFYLPNWQYHSEKQGKWIEAENVAKASEDMER